MKQTQRETNPFPHSDTNKRYYTYDYFLKHMFGGKCAKISLDAGMTCPNIDGTCGSGGCIYCLAGSASSDRSASLEAQYEAGITALSKKWDFGGRCIPYLQAYTNTYAAPERLREIYSTAAHLRGAVMLDIATRADCLDDDVCGVLAETAEILPLTVELGLQSVHDSTARFIRRGHTFDDFLRGYARLCDTASRSANRIYTCIHLIDGLPGEDFEMMLDSARAVSALEPDMVKLHLLHVLRGTVLYDMHASGDYTPMTEENYVATVAEQIALMPPDCVIARVTGDGRRDELAAPLWSLRKTAVTNDIDKYMYLHDLWQGKNR